MFNTWLERIMIGWHMSVDMVTFSTAMHGIGGIVVEADHVPMIDYLMCRVNTLQHINFKYVFK